MQLALFTPGAYLWPVHRNFEAFIAALGTAGSDVLSVNSSALYPARQRSDSAVFGLSSAVDNRLILLHRELYSALLRPKGYFATETRLFADRFWPDLRYSTVDSIFEALSFFFTGRLLPDLDVQRGLSLLRAIFFNHEAADPELWLEVTLERLKPERLDSPQHGGSLFAPPSARVEELAFCLHGKLGRPAVSSGWIRGLIRRQFDGRLRAEYSCGRDPGLSDENHYLKHRQQLDADVARQLRAVFGWREAIAA